MVFPRKVLAGSMIVAASVVLVYFVFIHGGKNTSGNPSGSTQAESPKKPAETPLPVKAVAAKKMDLVIKLRSPGEAMTNRKVVLKAEVPGVVSRLNVQESQHVKKGDVLIALEDEQYRLDVEKLEADRLRVLSELLLEKKFDETQNTSSSQEQSNAAILKKDYEKARKLFQQGKASQAELKQAAKNYEYGLIESGGKKEEVMAATKRLTQTEIELKKARLQLAKTHILAPFDGIITNIKISPQEHVITGRELFTLVNIHKIQVNAKVLESEIGKMQVNRDVDLKFSAYPDRVFKGKVKAISPIVNPEDRTCRVIIDVENPQEEIKPGMHAEVEIAAEIYKNRLLVPQDAVLSRTGRKLVFVVVNGVAKWRYVEIGLENEEYAEILDGVKEGDQVLTEGHFTLAHDAKVRIVK